MRPSYRSNFGPTPADINSQVFRLIFNDNLPDSPDPNDLRGGKRAPTRFIDWQTFFDFGDNNVRPNKKIDTTLSIVLFDLLGFAPGDVQSLAQRNLLRHLTYGLPAVQSVARAMKLAVLDAGPPERHTGHVRDYRPATVRGSRRAAVSEHQHS